MVGRFIHRLGVAITRFEHAIANVFGRGPPGALALAGIQESHYPQNPSGFSLKDFVGNGLLWAVPTSRRTIERRWKRKYGSPEYVWKMFKPKTTIKTCSTCGDDYEIGVLCSTCYKKVIDETKEMQEAIQAELKLEPVEKEVVVLYEGEKNEKPDEFWEGKRIVEMKKPRPSWFSKNLLQQTTQQPASTSDVKPSDLG